MVQTQLQEQEIIDTARAILGNSTIRELRHLRVEERGDNLHLRGAVSSFYHKQLAQELVRPAASDRGIVNEIEVR